jgi:S1/P1 Nuclease
MLRIVVVLNFLVFLVCPTAASAWGFEGHRVVGSIAEELLRLKPNAKQQIQKILNDADFDSHDLDLRKVGPWADCVRSVARYDDGKFHYVVDPDHLEYEVPCTPFNSARERARIVDYARRNWKCEDVPRQCHTMFHFEDVAIQRNSFDRNFQGTNDHDLVAAIGAAIAVLKDKPAPPPFSIKDKKEALILLVHFVGDLHQPLHVGSVYLGADGKLVDPDIAHQIDPATETAGGNSIQDQNVNLHHEWDDIPQDIGDTWTRELLADAMSVPASQGPIESWPAAWATDTILVAQDAFKGVSFQLTDPPPKATFNKWTLTFDDRMAYLRSMDAIKRKQLAKGGARLAEILNAIWP